MLAQGILALSLVVRIHDAYGVPGHDLAKARTTAAGIMKAAGVDVTWPQCPCLSPVRGAELVVRVTPAPPASTPGSLGFSLVDLELKAGILATVFADRVQRLAAIAAVDDGELLGRVIAHELSHLLIGTRDHGPRGLMRDKWRVSELVEQRRSDWLLSRADSIKIRQAIRRRSSTPPAMLAADGDPRPKINAQ